MTQFQKRKLIAVAVLIATSFGLLPVAQAKVANKNEESFWWKGEVSQALELAKKENKLLFIYWGAQWCPPCNEMKANVFSKRELQDAIENMIPVMIDGDSDSAQKWSDTFSATGYPTVLILSPDASSKARFVGYVPLETLLGAIQSAKASSQSLLSLVQKVSKSENLTTDEWRVLSFGDWSTFTEKDTGGKSPTEVALGALDKMPENLKSERALLSLFILATAADANAETQKRIRDQYEKLLATMTASPQVSASVLDFFSWGAPTLKWAISGDVPLETQKTRVALWNHAIDDIAKKSSDSLTERLNIACAKAAIIPMQPVNAENILASKKALDALEKELSQLTDSHQTTATIPKLADAYTAIGDYKKAITVLERAAGQSPVPYYFMSHIASILSDEGEHDQAVTWRERAMRASKGSATRLQWTWGYLKSLEKSTLKDRDRRIELTIDDILKQVITNPDAFHGRNTRYFEKTSGFIAALPTKSKKLIASIETFKKQCATLKDEARQKECSDYFGKLPVEATSVETPKKA